MVTLEMEKWIDGMMENWNGGLMERWRNGLEKTGVMGKWGVGGGSHIKDSKR